MSNNNNVSTEQQETKEESFDGGGEKIRNQKSKFKTYGYSTKARRVIYIVELLVVFCLCVLIFPFLLKWIAECFSKNSYVASDFTADKSGLDFLPDFLGGLIGILVGFFLDDFFIDQIKYLSKYVSLRNQIITEFNDILDLPVKVSELSETDVRTIIKDIKESCLNLDPDAVGDIYSKKFKKSLDKLKSYYAKHTNDNHYNLINLFALSDIVDSVENSVVFNSLPLLVIPINWRRPVGEYLLRAKAAVDRFNRAVNSKDKEEVDEKRKEQLFYIYVYIVKTLCFIDKREFNKKYIKIK